MKYVLTLFKNRFDTATTNTFAFDDFEDFERILYDLHALSTTKKKAPLISSATYGPTDRRANRNVVKWAGWCAMDVDSFIVDCTDDLNALQDALYRICGEYTFVCYSTASSTLAHPKFRLVFPLTKDIEAKKIKHFWYALNKQVKDIGDAQTKDLSRMFYIPGQYPDAFNFIYTNHGKPVNPDGLMRKWEYREPSGNSFLDRLPEEMKEQIIAYRKEQMTNTDIVWTSYRDCPFFPKKLASEYRAISGTGWYHKMYQIMIATAGNAIAKEYPITAREITAMCKQLDAETGNWYEDRPLELEATGAIEYVYRN